MEFLPSYKEIKTWLLLLHASRLFIEESCQTGHRLLNGHDQRLLLIVGPSFYMSGYLSYASRLRKLVQAVAPQYSLVMRVYCVKLCTTYGWKRFLIAVTALKHILIQNVLITQHLDETPSLPA